MTFSISLLLLFAALLLSASELQSKYQKKVETLHSDWLLIFNRGLSNEFLFFEIKQIKKWTRWAFITTVALSFLTLSIWPILGCIALVWALPHFTLKYIQTQRRKIFQKQFARSLSQIASILRAGHSFERALTSISENQPNPLGQEVGLVLKEMRVGSTMNEALGSLLARFPSRDLEILIHAISISRKVGTNLADVFSKVSDMIETRQQLRNRLSMLTAQGRVQAWIAIFMPIALLVVVHFLAPDYLEPLFYTGTGHLILLLCSVALAIGGVWIHKISHMELMR